MTQRLMYFFKIAKEANMAKDENGNPSVCYLRITFDLKRPISEEEIEVVSKTSQDGAIKMAAKFLKKDPSLLMLISEQEYEESTEKESNMVSKLA